MRGRPNLYVSYQDEQSILPTWTQRLFLAALLFGAILLPLGALSMGKLLPLVDGPSWLFNFEFFADSGWLIVIDRALIFMVAALGLNILTGLAGQVSLGHAFFMGLGAYTAAALGGSAEGQWGLGLPIWIWLPAAGLLPALIGILVAPTAVRVRGLYLAFVTLGLVFIGEHIFRNFNAITGPPELGREWPGLELRLWKEETPLVDFASDGPTWFFVNWLDWLLGPWINFGDTLTKEAKAYFLLLLVGIVFVLLAKNLTRTRIGRSFAAIRDRDVAAEVMGVGEAKAKTQAFAVSSFYAGIAGALLAALVGRLIPEFWNLFLSVQFVAIILIGGAGTVAGTVLGSFFVVLLPKIVEDITHWMAIQAADGGFWSFLVDPIVKLSADDFGLISTAAQGPGLSVFQMNALIYGLLIAVFLIFEPLGLYGIWIRIRNYWKGWPFTY